MPLQRPYRYTQFPTNCCVGKKITFLLISNHDKCSLICFIDAFNRKVRHCLKNCDTVSKTATRRFKMKSLALLCHVSLECPPNRALATSPLAACNRSDTKLRSKN